MCRARRSISFPEANNAAGEVEIQDICWSPMARKRSDDALCLTRAVYQMAADLTRNGTGTRAERGRGRSAPSPGRSKSLFELAVECHRGGGYRPVRIFPFVSMWRPAISRSTEGIASLGELLSPSR